MECLFNLRLGRLHGRWRRAFDSVLWSESYARGRVHHCLSKNKTKKDNLVSTYAGKAEGGALAWASTSAVPEPTSGLLLLLGVAGLALRRRRA